MPLSVKSSPLLPPGVIDQKPFACPLLKAFTPLDGELAVAFHCVLMSEENKQDAQKKIFWIILACGPCGIGVSILLFGFPKAGAYGSYEGWEGWVLGLAAFFVAWRHKKKISNDTSEKSE